MRYLRPLRRPRPLHRNAATDVSSPPGAEALSWRISGETHREPGAPLALDAAAAATELLRDSSGTPVRESASTHVFFVDDSMCQAKAGEETPTSEGAVRGGDELRSEGAAQLKDAVKDEPGAAWADETVCLRYLAARKGDLGKATQMLTESLRWRESFGVATLGERGAIVRSQSATGKMRVSESVDREGRPVLVMAPRLENSVDHDANLLNLVYHLERATGQRSVPGIPDGKLVTVMDFKGYSLRTAPPMKTSRATLSILQNHYPERLHKFLLMNVPGIFAAFWSAISPFIDPVTKAKVVFLRGSPEQQRALLAEHFDLAQLEDALGGDRPFTWDPDAYFASDSGLAQ